MNVTATNPTVTAMNGSTPAASPVAGNGSTSSPAKESKARQNDRLPVIVNITQGSDTALFTPSPAKFEKLDGEYAATITDVSFTELPPSEPKPSKKHGRKAKGAKGKAAAKAKGAKSGAKLVLLKFTLDHKRADGMTYTVEKEVRAQQDRESRFGEFMKKVLTDEASFNQFFSDYRLSPLLNRRCSLKLKEARCKGQSSIRILDVLPAPVLAPGFQHSGKTGSSVTGPIAEHALALDKAA